MIEDIKLPEWFKKILLSNKSIYYTSGMGVITALFGIVEAVLIKDISYLFMFFTLLIPMVVIHWHYCKLGGKHV